MIACVGCKCIGYSWCMVKSCNGKQHAWLSGGIVGLFCSSYQTINEVGDKTLPVTERIVNIADGIHKIGKSQKILIMNSTLLTICHHS